MVGSNRMAPGTGPMGPLGPDIPVIGRRHITNPRNDEEMERIAHITAAAHRKSRALLTEYVSFNEGVEDTAYINNKKHVVTGIGYELDMPGYKTKVSAGVPGSDLSFEIDRPSGEQRLIDLGYPKQHITTMKQEAAKHPRREDRHLKITKLEKDDIEKLFKEDVELIIGEIPSNRSLGLNPREIAMIDMAFSMGRYRTASPGTAGTSLSEVGQLKLKYFEPFMTSIRNQEWETASAAMVSGDPASPTDYEAGLDKERIARNVFAIKTNLFPPNPQIVKKYKAIVDEVKKNVEKAEEVTKEAKKKILERSRSIHLAAPIDAVEVATKRIQKLAKEAADFSFEAAEQYDIAQDALENARLYSEHAETARGAIANVDEAVAVYKEIKALLPEIRKTYVETNRNSSVAQETTSKVEKVAAYNRKVTNDLDIDRAPIKKIFQKLEIVVSLPESDQQSNSDPRVGQLMVYRNGIPIFGPVPARGEAAQNTAAANGNPTRDPKLPFGDTPYGTSDCQYIPTGINAPNGSKVGSTERFGDNGGFVFYPRPGSAAWERQIASGKPGQQMIHGGVESSKIPGNIGYDGRLIGKSNGCVKISDVDMKALADVLKKYPKETMHTCRVQKGEAWPKDSYPTQPRGTSDGYSPSPDLQYGGVDVPHKRTIEALQDIYKHAEEIESQLNNVDAAIKDIYQIRNGSKDIPRADRYKAITEALERGRKAAETAATRYEELKKRAGDLGGVDRQSVVKLMEYSATQVVASYQGMSVGLQRAANSSWTSHQSNQLFKLANAVEHSAKKYISEAQKPIAEELSSQTVSNRVKIRKKRDHHLAEEAAHRRDTAEYQSRMAAKERAIEGILTRHPNKGNQLTKMSDRRWWNDRIANRQMVNPDNYGRPVNIRTGKTEAGMRWSQNVRNRRPRGPRVCWSYKPRKVPNPAGGSGTISVYEWKPGCGKASDTFNKSARDIKANALLLTPEALDVSEEVDMPSLELTTE